MIKLTLAVRGAVQAESAIFLNPAHIVSIRDVKEGASVVTSEMRQDESWIVTENASTVATIWVNSQSL
jgi:hypothetical protein